MATIGKNKAAGTREKFDLAVRITCDAITAPGDRRHHAKARWHLGNGNLYGGHAAFSCFLRKRAAPDAILSHPCALGAHCGNTRKRHVDPHR